VGVLVAHHVDGVNVLKLLYMKEINRDPKEPLNPSKEELKECNYYWGESEEDEMKWKQDISHINMFWERNFYPNVQMVANDLHKKGLIEAGEYSQR
jgi:hypothetical protein